MDLALEFADRRAGEIVHQMDADLPVGDGVIQRLMNQDDLALGIAAGAGDADAPAALEKVRERMENHERVLEYLELGTGPSASAALLQTRQTLRMRLELLNGDLQDPQLRVRIMEQVRNRTNAGSATPAGPGSPNGGAGGQGSGAGTDTGGGNPWTEGTPTPESGYGPGPGPDATCACADTCTGPGAGGSGQPGGNAEKTPAVGCTCTPIACTPLGGGGNQKGKP
jgi:hypothetical protein